MEVYTKAHMQKTHHDRQAHTNGFDAALEKAYYSGGGAHSLSGLGGRDFQVYA